MNTFRFVGKIKKIEDKKDKKFIETLSFEKSGWELTKVKFRLVTDESAEFVDVSGGKFKDDNKNTVYTAFTKEGSTNKRETETAQVKWNERFDPAVVEKVPDFKRYTVDLSSDKIREALVKEGKNAEASELAAKKYSYISNYDFVKKVEELITTGAFGDENYVITGSVEYTFSVTKQAYYKNFVATNIYKASAEEATGHFGKLDFYYKCNFTERFALKADCSLLKSVIARGIRYSNDDYDVNKLYQHVGENDMDGADTKYVEYTVSAIIRF